MKIRPTKSQVVKIVTEKAPEYVEFFTDVKADAHGWLILPDKFLQCKKNLNINQYVTLYKDQKTIDVCLMLFLMGKDEFKAWNSKLAALSASNQQSELESFTQDFIDTTSSEFDEMVGKWPETPEDEAKLRQDFESLDDETKKLNIERAQFLWIHIFLSIHNFFSVMVNGESMVSLVPKAIQGDDEAFCKAVKIDYNLLDHHPYFIERLKQAKLNGETCFLKDLSKYQAKPTLIGTIRLPGLYFVFAMLEIMDWLNDFTHDEILDLCDAAGLDRWQHRIEDTNAVTKRLKQYRQYQKTGGVSMH